MITSSALSAAAAQAHQAELRRQAERMRAAEGMQTELDRLATPRPGSRAAQLVSVAASAAAVLVAASWL